MYQYILLILAAMLIASPAMAQSLWPADKVQMDSGNTLQEDVNAGVIGGAVDEVGDIQITTCAAGYVLKDVTGTSGTWSCQPDATSGTLDSLGDITLPCPAGSVLQQLGDNDGIWTCQSAAGAEVNDLATTVTGGGDRQVFVGTGPSAGAWVALPVNCDPDAKLEYVGGSPDTFDCEAIGGLTEADITLTDVDLLGTPTAPTAADGVTTTQIATTAYVQGELDGALGGDHLTCVGGICDVTLNGTVTWTAPILDMGSVLSFGDGGEPAMAITYDVSTGVDPVVFYSGGVIDWTAGELRQGGSPVLLDSDIGPSGGSTVQAWDADLDVISGLDNTQYNVIIGGASDWESLAQPRIDGTNFHSIPEGGLDITNPGAQDGWVLSLNDAGNNFTWVEGVGGPEDNDLVTDGVTGIASTEIVVGTATDTVIYTSLSGAVTMDNTGSVSFAADALSNMAHIAAGIKRGADATDTHILTTDATPPGSAECLEMDTDGSIVLAGGACSVSGGAPDQNLFESVVSDSGTATADTTTDALTIVGDGTIVTTAVAGDDILTITGTAHTATGITAGLIVDADVNASAAIAASKLIGDGGGTLTADGLILGATETIRLGSTETIQHDATNFLISDDVVVTGTVTADGLTVGQNENITLNSATISHDGTDILIDDTVAVTGDFTATGTFGSGPSASPQMLLTDSTLGGRVAVIISNDAAGPEAVMDLQVGVGADVLTTFVQIDGINENVEIGDPGTGWIDIDNAGGLTSQGTGSITLADANDAIALETVSITSIGDDELMMGDGVGSGVFIPMPVTGASSSCHSAGEALQYNVTSNSFECITGLAAGGSGSVTSVKEDDVLVGTADAVAIDFGPSFDVAAVSTDRNVTIAADSIGRTQIDETLLSIQTHATDCTTLTCDAGSDGEQCFEQDSDALYICDGSGTPAWALATGGGGGATTSAAGFTYPTTLTDDFVIGAVDATAPFVFDVGTGDMTATGDITSAASAAPQILLQDTTTSGETSIEMSDGAGPDGVMMLKVDVADTLTTFAEFDGINSDIELGTPGTNYVDITTAGVMSFEGTAGLELPTDAAPTTDVDGEIAVDLDGWGSGFDAIEFFNGTASAYVVATTATDTPTNGQVPKWNTGGSITWEDDAGAAGGDSISIDSVAVVDPDFQSGGDIDFIDTTNVVTANINTGAVDVAELATVLTFGATDHIDLSATDGSATNEGLTLPQDAVACTGGFAEGQICWEPDGTDTLKIGNGTGFEVIVPLSGWDAVGEFESIAFDVVTPTDADTLTNKTITGGLATTTHDASGNFLSTLHHATDCTAITDGVRGELCIEEDANTLYSCQPTAGGCDTAGEWILTGDGGGTVNTADIADVSVTQAELTQLETLDTTTISAAEWTALDNLSGTNSGDQSDASIIDSVQTACSDGEALMGNASTTCLAISGANTGDEVAASLTVSGIVEVATQAEADAGTDTLRTISPDTLDGFALSTDLGGTLGAPTVVDDSHNHIQSNIDALTHTESFVLFDGVATAGEEMLVHTNVALTLVSLDCVGTGGSTPTTTYTVMECTSGGATCVSSGLAASLTALDTLVTDDSPTDAAVDANDWWGLEATTLTTEPNLAHCTVEYTIP